MTDLFSSGNEWVVSRLGGKCRWRLERLEKGTFTLQIKWGIQNNNHGWCSITFIMFHCFQSHFEKENSNIDIEAFMCLICRVVDSFTSRKKNQHSVYDIGNLKYTFFYLQFRCLVKLCVYLHCFFLAVNTSSELSQTVVVTRRCGYLVTSSTTQINL